MEKCYDYEIVQKYKDGTIGEQQEVVGFLYTKYQPLMRSMASAYINHLGKDKSVDFEDLVSDYAELIYKVLKYIDLKKIPDGKKISIAHIFKKYISSYSRAKARLIDTHPELRPDSLLTLSQRSIFSKINEEDNKRREDEVLQKYKRFKATQTGMMYQLLCLFEANTSNKDILRIMKFRDIPLIYYYKKKLIGGFKKCLFIGGRV